MIIFSGLGGAVVVFGLVGVLFLPLLFEEHLPQWVTFFASYDISSHEVCIVVTGIVTIIFGRFVNSRIFSWNETDHETGEVTRTRLVSSLFWIPVQYWGIPFIGLGVLSYFDIIAMV